MNGGFSPIVLVVWVLILVGIFWIAAITPWRPLRMVLKGFGILLVALSLWNLVVQILWFRRS
jgi:hypothetical protein